MMQVKKEPHKNGKIILYIKIPKGSILLDDATRQVFQAKDIRTEAYLEQPDVMKFCCELGLKKSCLRIDELIQPQRSS